MSAWSPPRWFYFLEAFQFGFFPVVLLATAIYSVVIGDSDAARVCLIWAALMTLMIPLLAGDSMRETLERWRAPRRIVWLYCDTRFPGFLSIAFWVVLFASSRKVEGQ